LPFEEAQYETLVHVTACLQQAYPQIQQHLAGHSDIAPGRKTDPGPFFDWLGYRNRLQQLKSQ
jgi:N-acetyl-anhydromuramoyl-L-alanine amidase